MIFESSIEDLNVFFAKDREKAGSSEFSLSSNFRLKWELELEARKYGVKEFYVHILDTAGSIFENYKIYDEEDNEIEEVELEHNYNAFIKDFDVSVEYDLSKGVFPTAIEIDMHHKEVKIIMN